MGRPATDKRQRLVRAAVDLFHRGGFAATSLADVARSAGVAPGNVFYHFRAKDDLARAVVEAWCEELKADLAEMKEGASDRTALRRFIEGAESGCEGYVGLGCPLAALARDLSREGEGLRAEVPRLFAAQEEWVRARLVGVGLPPEDAESEARVLLGRYNGAILMAHARSDPRFIVEGVAAMLGWLDGLGIARAS